MEEIDTANVIGSRTRGKNIDFAKANQELGDDASHSLHLLVCACIAFVGGNCAQIQIADTLRVPSMRSQTFRRPYLVRV
jgi:hypothetical protein